MMYLFGFVADDEPVASMPMLGDVSVRRLPLGAVDAIVAPAERSVETQAAMRVHVAVVRALFDAGATILPAQLGQTVAGDAAFATSGMDPTALRASLERYRGLAEMTAFSALPTRAPQPGSESVRGGEGDGVRGPGAAYLERLRRGEGARDRSRDDMTGDLLDEQAPGLLVLGAFLIGRAAALPGRPILSERPYPRHYPARPRCWSARRQSGRPPETHSCRRTP